MERMLADGRTRNASAHWLVNVEWLQKLRGQLPKTLVERQRGRKGASMMSVTVKRLACDFRDWDRFMDTRTQGEAGVTSGPSQPQPEPGMRIWWGSQARIKEERD